MNRKNRDERYRKAVKEGRTCQRRTSSNQLFHPMNVEDFEQETGNQLSESDKGFGNIIYKTPFPKLYVLEID